MAKNYEKPLAKALEMGSEDIIQTSGGGLIDGGEEGTIGGEEGGGSVVGGGGAILGLKNIPTGIKTPNRFM